ncbi:MAG: Multi-sensor hybrid histidine kinase [Candidatus Magnetoglobus multicellularis str. Araruama]|uniref:histidine kinase n=1 Tax=Candidatus Magnetoglobus multicellularis str. Araruama TaxID=890399 RepID=A0A1V1PEG3_9BACT|nr:MAG: Multi-sensor hybrid histidine kinase [Candidatus Magnetoglobus multicellularis str. Araruama]
MNHKPIAIIATPEEDQMERIKAVCNSCHMNHIGVKTMQEVLDHTQQKPYTILFISDMITEDHLCNEILTIRNQAINKYLPVLVLCSTFPSISNDKMKLLIRAPFDIIENPINSNILTCKVHMLLTLNHQKQALQSEIQKSARAISAKNAFLSSITHEIRTPINSIIGMSDLLMDEKLDQDQKKFVRSIRCSGEMLLALFNTKIDYTNIQTDTLQLDSKVFESKSIIEKISAMLDGYLKSKRTKLITKIDPDLPRVLLGDPYRFEQVLFNILLVSIEQTINNSVTLHIKVHSKQHDIIKLYLCIEDENIGLTDQQKHSLTDDSDADFGNAHIGLFVTRHIVRKMDGNIGFSINNEKRAEFWCTICFTKTSQGFLTDCEIADEEQTRVLKCESLQAEDIRILLVEDSPINQLLGVKTLNKMGFTQIETADNGEEAINCLTQKDFDLVLMDIFMPVMNGLEASRLIRHQKTIRNPNLPIVAMTAQDTDLIQNDFKNYGISTWLSKPFEIEKLATVLTQIFPGLTMSSLNNKRGHLSDQNNESKSSDDRSEKTNKMTVFDKKKLLERLDGDEALYQDLIQGFLSDIPVQINKLEKALDFDDLTIAERTAHTLKGAFSNVGAQILQKIAQDLENNIQNGDIDKITMNIHSLKKVF